MVVFEGLLFLAALRGKKFHQFKILPAACEGNVVSCCWCCCSCCSCGCRSQLSSASCLGCFPGLHPPLPLPVSSSSLYDEDVDDADDDAGVRTKRSAFLLQTLANKSIVPTTIVPFPLAPVKLPEGSPVAPHLTNCQHATMSRARTSEMTRSSTLHVDIARPQKRRRHHHHRRRRRRRHQHHHDPQHQHDHHHHSLSLSARHGPRAVSRPRGSKAT